MTQPRTLFIPEIGTQFRLAMDWTFTLYAESRNAKFGAGQGLHTYYKYSFEGGELETKEVTLPAGTLLKLSRIYVRQGSKASGFSSVTFRAWGPKPEKGKPKGLGLFWVKLDDANRIPYFLEGA